MEKAIIFCAPSGSGKTTIVKHLLQVFPQLSFSVSACTRARRENEQDGKDYYFLTQQAFKQRVVNGEFLEFEEVYSGHFYGTLKSEIQRIWDLQKIVIFDVDVEGGLNLKTYFGDKALAVFVKPPSVDELARRLRERLTESEESLKIRVGKAVLEMEYQSKFDVVIINDELTKALEEAEHIIRNFIES